MNCWAIWIDIEGFFKMYPKNQVIAHSLVGAIMEGILDAGETLLLRWRLLSRLGLPFGNKQKVTTVLTLRLN